MIPDNPLLEKDASLIEENLSYYDGTGFWAGAITPKLPEDKEANRVINERTYSLFQSANKVYECVTRHRNALVGNLPTYSFSTEAGTIDGEPSAKLNYHLLKLINWWKVISFGRYRYHTDPITKMIDNTLTTGYGYLRLWAPTKYAASNNPYQRIALHSPDPNSVNLIRDNDGFVDRVEYSFIYEEKPYKEVQKIDEKGLTLFYWTDEKDVRVLMPDGSEELRINLGGNYTVQEYRRRPMITESIKRAQNAINHTLSLIPTNNEFSGFLLHLIGNGLPPGTWQPQQDKPPLFVPGEDLIFAPGTVHYVPGLPIFSKEGGNQPTGYTTPSFNIHDPVNIQPLIDSYRAFCAVIYEACNQSHILSQDLTISGISRQQLRADFRSSLLDDRNTVEAILGACFSTAICMFLGNPATQVEVNLMLNLGEPSPDERKDIREDFKTGLLSRLTAITLNSYVDNAGAEVEQIEAETEPNTDTNPDDIIDIQTSVG